MLFYYYYYCHTKYPSRKGFVVRGTKVIGLVFTLAGIKQLWFGKC